MFQINAFATTKLINDFHKKASYTNFLFPTGNLSDQLGKLSHKFIHIMHFHASQYANKKILRTAISFPIFGPIIEQG